MNDKWVSGQDFKNRTIFEDFLFLDRANRDIGNKVVINIEKLRQTLNGDNGKMTLFSLLSTIYKDNDFVFMPTPVYINFYGLNDRIKDGEPIPQDIPNNLFGTFMEVDANDSRPKMLGVYVGKPSEHLDDKDFDKSRRLDDSFDLTRASANPLIENQINKKDYSNSNKCVGFTVDFGVRNQGIFKTLDIDMSQFKNTSETYQILEDMGNLSSLQSVAQQSQSMYSIYKSKSFNCKVSCLGNAMLQPTMYFNLRHVPMFNGPYLIINVNHSISIGNFTTQFEGVRIPTSALKIPDKLVMSVNKEILKTYQKKIYKKLERERELNEILINAEGNLNIGNLFAEPENSCSDINFYENKPFVDAVDSSFNTSDILNRLKAETSVNEEILKFIYGIAKISSEQPSGGLKCFNNNLFFIKTNVDHRALSEKFESQICLNNGDYSLPYASFTGVEQSIEFMIEKYKNYDSILSKLFFGTNVPARAEGMAILWASTWLDDFGYGKTSDEIKDIINNSLDDLEYEKMFNKTAQKFERAITEYES